MQRTLRARRTELHSGSVGCKMWSHLPEISRAALIYLLAAVSPSNGGLLSRVTRNNQHFQATVNLSSPPQKARLQIHPIGQQQKLMMSGTFLPSEHFFRNTQGVLNERRSGRISNILTVRRKQKTPQTVKPPSDWATWPASFGGCLCSYCPAVCVFL